MAIDSKFQLWTWGDNSISQLGDTIINQTSTPRKIGNDSNWLSVSAGYAFSTAIKRNHSLWSWGFNGNGQLGQGTLATLVVPTQIGLDLNWDKIIAGGSYVFAIKQDSSLWAWGYNGMGQLGTGNTIQKLNPTNVGIDKKWIAVAAATGFAYNSSLYGLHSLALSKDKNVICSSGANYAGQLGNGSTIDKQNFDCNTGFINSLNEAAIIKKQKLIIYPNPATDQIKFAINKQGVKLQNIRIYNASGCMVLYQNTNYTLFTYSVSSLPKGIYFVEIQSEKGEVFREKFVRE